MNENKNSKEVQTITEEHVCDECGKLQLFNDVAYNDEENCQCQGYIHSSVYELIRRKDVLKLIEKMMDIDQMNPEMTDEALKKERLFTLRELKQKLKGDNNGNE